MYKEIILDGMAQRIKYKVYAFASGYQKQKQDELAVLSRNILSAKGMLAKRNPDIPAYQRSYDYFRAERMKWKKAVETGEATRDAYREWLLKMQEQKIIKEAFDGID